MERITRVRAGIFLLLFSIVIGFFALKLYDQQIIETGGNIDNTKYFTTVTRVKAARGEILDCNGNVLVSNRASYDLVFNHYVTLSAKGTNDYLLSLVKLCREMDIEYNDHFPVTKDAPYTYTLSEFNTTWQSYFQRYLPEIGGGLDSDITASLLMKKLRTIYKIPAEWPEADARAVIGMRYELALRGVVSSLPCYVFLEDVQNDVLSAILELNIPGLNTEASTVREYNTKYAAHILGYVGAMDGEQWEYYKNLEDQTYEMDALVGQAGFELAFEKYLHGTDGWRVDEYYADGTLKQQYYRKVDGVEQKPISGKNVEVTIDLNLQRAAEDSMENLITTLRASAVDGQKVDGSDVEGGAVVVMDVKTGGVLACASYPTYDLSTYFENFDELKDAEGAPMFNRALMATYPPGSTYKMVMAIAGVHDGYISASSTIKTEGKYMKYAESDFTPSCLAWSMNGGTHGTIDVTVALQKSCNYFFYDVGDHISLSIMEATAKGLGLGEPTGIELGEKLGYRANAENKALLNKDNEDETAVRWYAADQVMAAIGQSINQFSPMQLCVYTSTLANRGIRYKATFLNRVVSSDYRHLEFKNQPQILSTMDISDEAYLAYSTGMKLAASFGTAQATFGNYPIPVAAKTGTAQHGLGKQYSDHGAFICYAPADDPQIAVVVYGEKAGHGTTMGQIAKAVLDTYFDNPEVGDVTTNENELS